MSFCVAPVKNNNKIKTCIVMWVAVFSESTTSTDFKFGIVYYMWIKMFVWFFINSYMLLHKSMNLSLRNVTAWPVLKWWLLFQSGFHFPRRGCNLDQTWLLFTAETAARSALKSPSVSLYLLGRIRPSLSPVKGGCNSPDPMLLMSRFLGRINSSVQTKALLAACAALATVS